MKKKSSQKAVPFKKVFYQCLSYAIALSNSACITDSSQSSKDLPDINFEQQYVDTYVFDEVCSEFREYIDISNTNISCIEHCQMQDTGERLLSCQYEKGDAGMIQVRCNREGSCAIPGRWTSIAGPKPLALAYSIQEEMKRRVKCEAVAVIAFERLAFELKAYQAPIELLAKIQVAIEDEKRHTSNFSSVCLAQNWEIEEDITHIQVSQYPVRSLLELAIENAIEGCVGESFAALENLYQSHFAKNQTIKALHQSIVFDEIAHAELSWQIHDWINQQLPIHEKVLLQEALVQAISGKISINPNCHLPEETKQYLGLPDHHTAKILYNQLNEQLWQKRIHPSSNLEIHQRII